VIIPANSAVVLYNSNKSEYGIEYQLQNLNIGYTNLNKGMQFVLKYRLCAICVCKCHTYDSPSREIVMDFSIK
jgi:hypothetical protein